MPDWLRALSDAVWERLWAGLLWLTGLYDQAVVAWLPPPWPTVLLSPRSHTAPLGLLLVLGFVMLLVFAKGRQRRRQQHGGKDEVKLPAMGSHALWGLFARHERAVRLGGVLGRVVFDVAWRHIGILGTSGARKSTLMALLLEQIGKTYVCLTGDHSPPLLNLTLARDGIVWRPRGEVGWYPWGGDLELAVQRVEHMFPATGNDAGVHRSMFKQAARQAWADVDERARDVRQIVGVLPSVVSGASGRMMVENWSARLLELVDSLGTSLCTAEEGGFDLVEELANGRDVMFALNSFADVSNRERFAKIATLEILRAADAVGNLSAAIDEVGLLGADLFAESVRTLRVRLCTGLFASHIAKDFPDVLKGLINVWFVGQIPGSDKHSRSWASDTTFGLVPAEHFGEHALPLGTFWLVANGRVQRVRVPTWQTRPVPTLPIEEPAAPPAPVAPPPPRWGATRKRVQRGPHPRGAVTELPRRGAHRADQGADPIRDAAPPAAPRGTSRKDQVVSAAGGAEQPDWLPDDEQLANIWAHHVLVGGHQLSTYRLNNRGRPTCKYNREEWLPYALLRAVHDGLDLREVRHRMADRSPQGITIDHLCRQLDPSLSEDDEKRCQTIEHTRWMTRSGNTAVQWRRRAVAAMRVVP